MSTFSASLTLYLYVNKMLFTSIMKFPDSVYLSLEFQLNAGCFGEHPPVLGPIPFTAFLCLAFTSFSVATAIA